MQIICLILSEAAAVGPAEAEVLAASSV